MNQLQTAEKEILAERIEVYKGVNFGTHTLEQLKVADEKLRLARLALLDWEQDERVKRLDKRGYTAYKDTLALFGHELVCQKCNCRLVNEHEIERHERNWHR
jgi:hypothetical protein